VLVPISLILVLSAAAGDVCSGPASSPAICSPADDPGLRAAVAPLLGAIDRPVPQGAWQRLPPGALHYLELLAGDPSGLPTRRARALEGAAALGADGSLHRRLAEDGAAPYIVRSAALAHVASLLPSAEGRGLLANVLTRDPDALIRAAAAQALASASPTDGCERVRGQARREGSETRAAFRQALRACGDR
jgi:hypothetical protein